ncbi:hypothetical protein CANINC_004992 [Pichia inconspicua]|uniref:Serine/threonine-protein kinase BUR1 n=1 Tax=Pichia inconspicua TaxID=52247 RepID=A0A4T0WUZ0_9ASCO|nr:hypothetical protein CANINC_004992 [[Candida] inconspicua]
MSSTHAADAPPSAAGNGAVTTSEQNGVSGATANVTKSSTANKIHRRPPPMATLDNYELYNQLGQGTFGVVTKARHKGSNQLVALKKFLITDKKEGFPITAFREITIMKKLKHKHVLQIIDMVYEKKGSFFYTVCPYISSDLNGLINNPRISFSLPQIKCLMQQILEGINYVHQSGYLHRDIKTANILLDKFGTVKIADFGLARLFHGPPPTTPSSSPGGGLYEYTGLVVTRWYRPPELLLGDRKYTTAVDMWGIGCVFGEFFFKRPILEGKSDLHQAELIFKLLGSPTPENFPNAHLINRHNIDLKHNYPRTLESAFSKFMSPDAISLLSGMLTLNPQQRFNALKALKSPFFSTEPLPSDQTQLANLEDSHESDVKRFKDEKSQKLHHSKFQQSGANSLNHSKYGVDDPALMNRSESTATLSQPLAPQLNDRRDYHKQRTDYPRRTPGTYSTRDVYAPPHEDRRNYHRDYQDTYYSQSHSEVQQQPPPPPQTHQSQPPPPPPPYPPHAQSTDYPEGSFHSRRNSLPKHQLSQIQRHLQASSRPKRPHHHVRRSQYMGDEHYDNYDYYENYDNYEGYDHYEGYGRYDATAASAAPPSVGNIGGTGLPPYSASSASSASRPVSASKRLKSIEPASEKFSSLAGGKDLYGKSETSTGLSFLSKVIKQKKQDTKKDD